jgi:hypothetical protein
MIDTPSLMELPLNLYSAFTFKDNRPGTFSEHINIDDLKILRYQRDEVLCASSKPPSRFFDYLTGISSLSLVKAFGQCQHIVHPGFELNS